MLPTVKRWLGQPHFSGKVCAAVRWPVNGSGVLGSWETTLPAVTHADGSVSLSYFRNTPYGYCAANYSATGDLRWLRCGGNAAAISLAADDDSSIVAGTLRQVSKLAATGQVRWEVTDTTYPSGNLSATDRLQRQLRRALEQHHPHRATSTAASVRSTPPVCLTKRLHATCV
jgi:hypothetical protein